MAFGRYLKSMRTQMGITIEAVADEIKISARQLALIEAEDHEQLPDVVYVKGILKAYARFIGVDEDDIVDRYTINRMLFIENQTAEAKHSKNRKKFLFRQCISAGLLIILLAALAYFIYGPQVISLVETGKNQPEIIEHPDSIGGADGSPGTLMTNQMDKLFLQIDALEDTWLKIIIDDAEPVEYSLHPMDHMELEASSRIKIQLGNAGGVKMLLNDQPVFVPGKKGDVINIELPPSE